MDFRWENVAEAKGNMHFTGEQHPPGENVPVPLVAKAAGASAHRSRSRSSSSGDSHCVRRTPSFIDCSCYACPFVRVLWWMSCDAPAPISAAALTPRSESPARWDHPSKGSDLSPTGSLPPLHAAPSLDAICLPPHLLSTASTGK